MEHRIEVKFLVGEIFGTVEFEGKTFEVYVGDIRIETINGVTKRIFTLIEA